MIETETGKELANLYKNYPGLEGIGSYAFSPNGKRLAIVCQFKNKFPEGTIRLWDIFEGKEVRTFQGPQPDPKSQAPNPYPRWLDFSPDGKTLAAAWNDKEIRSWEVESGRQLPIIPVEETTMNLRIRFSPDGKYLVWGSSRSLSRKTDKAIHFWDLKGRRESFRLEAPEGGATLLAFSREGRYFAVCGLNNTVCVWDLKSRSKD